MFLKRFYKGSIGFRGLGFRGLRISAVKGSFKGIIKGRWRVQELPSPFFGLGFEDSGFGGA